MSVGVMVNDAYRGVIERLDSVVPTSLVPSLVLSPDSKSIVWNIGETHSHSLEVVML